MQFRRQQDDPGSRGDNTCLKYRFYQIKLEGEGTADNYSQVLAPGNIVFSHGGPYRPVG